MDDGSRLKTTPRLPRTPPAFHRQSRLVPSRSRPGERHYPPRRYLRTSYLLLLFYF